jgi:hypothetical protein
MFIGTCQTTLDYCNEIEILNFFPKHFVNRVLQIIFLSSLNMLILFVYYLAYLQFM